MRILITGSKGTIATPLAIELRARGHEVLGCDLYHAAEEVTWAATGDSEYPTYTRCDVGCYRQTHRMFADLGPFDVVYHCAAEFGRWNGEDYYEQLWRSNALGTKNIIQMQQRYGFQLVYFSTSEVYGDWSGLMSEDILETHAVAQLNDYAISKWAGELQIRNAVLNQGTETVIVRLFNTYGPGEYYTPYRSVNCRFLYCALHGLKWNVYSGHHRTSTYVADTVRTLANIAGKFKPGAIYNIAGSEYHSIEELSDVVVEVTGASPALALRRQQERMTTVDKRPDIQRAFDDLGHLSSVSLRDGMRRTAQWMSRVYCDTIDPSISLHGKLQSPAGTA